jgi:hypothetical protein
LVRFASYKPSRGHALESYETLLKSTDWDKINRICQYFLGLHGVNFFPNQEYHVTPSDLLILLEKVKKVTSFPLTTLENFEEDEKAIHFRENRTFINLPYGEKVTAWPDRQALQDLIRQRFSSIFQQNDLVIVPGCADGQIPIEISANSENNEVDLKIVAADFNAAAMNIGYLTMQSFGLKSDKISWVQADVTKRRFFEWISASFPLEGRHQVVTLVQPSLREQSFLNFLKNSSALPHHHHAFTTVVMPVLLMDETSEWFQRCNGYVEIALKNAERNHEAPQFIWSQTKYGIEMLKLNTDKSGYIPEQYFIRPESLPIIQEETGFIDSSKRVFPEVIEASAAKDPRTITSAFSKRRLCIWDSKV